MSGRSDQLLINAAPGLGEAMVSGMVTPDTIVVDKATRAVSEFTPGDSGGGPVLVDDVRDELVGLSLEVERAFGAPVDIEAAHADDGWYLLQARPITTPVGASMTSEFPVDWLDPSDADITWEWDDMHMPAALSALAGDYVLLMGAGMAYGHRKLAIPVEMRIRIWNGYAYFGSRTDVPESEQAADVGAANRARPGGDPDDRRVLARAGGARAPRGLRLGRRAPVETMPARGSGGDLGRGLERDRPLLVDPLLRHPRAVPGARGPGRPVRIGHRRSRTG